MPGTMIARRTSRPGENNTPSPLNRIALGGFVRSTGSDTRPARAQAKGDTMRRADNLLISVTTDWNDWRSAHARLGDLRDVHWHQPKGAPRSMVHAYVSCADIVGGNFSHNCDQLSAPHRVRVCVLRSHNMPSVYAEVARGADCARIACPSSPDWRTSSLSPSALGGR